MKPTTREADERSQRLEALLLAMTVIHCVTGRNCFSSGFISMHGEVMRYLGECGDLVVDNDDGGRLVEAHMSERGAKIMGRVL